MTTKLAWTCDTRERWQNYQEFTRGSQVAKDQEEGIKQLC